MPARSFGHSSCGETVKKYLDVIRGLRFVRNKYDVLLHLVGLHRDETITYFLKNGIELLVPNRKTNRTTILSIKEIFVDEIYPARSEGLKTVVDIGAQSGIFSLYAAYHNPGAIIHSFEPDPGNYEQLCLNIKVNNFADRITSFNAAVAGRTEPVSFFINENSSRAHSMFGTGEGQKQVVVQALSLDDLFQASQIAQCDFLKIDIEGAEYDVLFNATRETLSKINKLVLECHPIQRDGTYYDITTMEKFLQKNGFHILQKEGDIIWAQRR